MSYRAIAFGSLGLFLVSCGSATLRPDGMAGTNGADGAAGAGGGGTGGAGAAGGTGGAGGAASGTNGTGGGSAGTGAAAGAGGRGGGGATGGNGNGGVAGTAAAGTGGAPACGGLNQACCAGNSCSGSSTACCGGSCVDVLSNAQHCGGSCLLCSGVRTFCSAGSCVQCVLDSDCALTSRKTCDFGSHACVCRRPSTNNLLVNPGFDTNLSGWGGILPTGEPNWQSDDADGCPESGSVHGANTQENTDNAPIQCVSVTAGTTYHFGAKFKAATNNQSLSLQYYSDANCQTYVPGGPFVRISTTPTNWSPLDTSAVPPVGINSVAIHCSIYDGAMDQIYLNAVSASF
jgi:hypothetical protein